MLSSRMRPGKHALDSSTFTLKSLVTLAEVVWADYGRWEWREEMNTEGVDKTLETFSL